jgi:sigma-54 dependent transcriptional regulator
VCRNPEIEAADISLIGNPDTLIGLAPGAAPVPGDQQVGAVDAATRSIEAAVGALLDARTPGILRAIEQLVTKVAYERCAGSQAQTARLLGITRNTMRTLLHRFRLLPGARDRLAH